MKSAFKIGSSGLKYKKFRLVMTILLSCVAFGLFGLADTFGAYDHIKTCTNSILDSGINYAALSKAYKMGDGLVEYWRDGLPMTQEDLTKLRQDTGIPFKGVLSQPSGDYLGFNANLGDMEKLADEGFQLHTNYFYGTVELEESELAGLGFTLVAGAMPDGSKNQLAVSTFIYRTFTKTGYRSTGANSDTVTEIKDPADLVGKTLYLNGETYTITGVIETGLDWDRYAHLAEDQEGADTADELLNFVLYSEFTYATSCNYTGMMLVGPGKVEAMLQEMPVLSRQDLYFMQFSDPGADLYLYSERTASLGNIDTSLITWLDGARTVLGPREIVVTSDILWSYAIGDEDANQTPDYTYAMDYDLDLYLDDWRSNSYFEESGYKIVGVIDVYTGACPFSSTIILPDGLYQSYAKVGEGQFSSVLAAMPSTTEGVRTLMEYCYDESGDMRYSVNNPVCYELDTVNELLQVFSRMFLYIGLGFCVFASILLANFIATSISYKKEEIGILRAIGSRSNDVFRIFFSESFIIAIINFAISTLGVLIATMVVNHVLRTEVGILITVLTFGIRQVLLILVVSLAVAFIASWFPVHRIAAKRPIDAIRNR